MMDDLISRRAAIEAIDETCWYHQNENKDMVGGANSAEHQPWFKSDDVYAALKSVPSARRWIPVTEQLPKEDKSVLVSVHFLGLDQRHKTGWNDHIKENWYVDIASYIDGNWTSYSDEYKVAKSRHIITAWMPLPEPYKEGE